MTSAPFDSASSVSQQLHRNRIITVRTRVNRLRKGSARTLVREGLKTQPERRIVMQRLLAYF